MVNTTVPSPEARDKYKKAGQTFVDPDGGPGPGARRAGTPGDYVSVTDVVRHDPMKVAARLVSLTAQ